MVSLKRLFSSTLGRKYLMGATGLALGLFVITHLLGNLTLYAANGDPINTYAARLEGLGYFIVAAELGLLLAAIVHVITAVQVTMTSKGARLEAYEHAKSKGGPTKNSVASRNMIWTGAVLFAFLVIHVIQFKYGPSIEAGYTTTVNGVMVRDLYRLVSETFSHISWVIYYCATMLFLGLHLRHGYWSAFQSLGILNPRWSKPIYTLGFILALFLTVGFFFIPIYIYVTQGGGGNT